MTFLLFQRVRIVSVYFPSLAYLIGKEGVVIRTNAVNILGHTGYNVMLDDFLSPTTSGKWFFNAGQMVPATYLPDAADLATQERAPDFNCPLPEYVGAGAA